MGHIDHAHHPEGNGQANGRQQQHRTQTQTEEQRIDLIIEGDLTFNTLHRSAGADADNGLIGGIGQRRQQVAHIGLQAGSEQVNGSDSQFRVGALFSLVHGDHQVHGALNLFTAFCDA